MTERTLVIEVHEALNNPQRRISNFDLTTRAVLFYLLNQRMGGNAALSRLSDCRNNAGLLLNRTIRHIGLWHTHQIVELALLCADHARVTTRGKPCPSQDCECKRMSCWVLQLRLTRKDARLMPTS